MKKLYVVATERERVAIFGCANMDEGCGLYKYDKYDVLVTGVGKVRATFSITRYLTGRIKMHQIDEMQVVNIGVCGADIGYSIGQVVEVGMVRERDFSTEPFDKYADIIKEHTIMIDNNSMVVCLTADRVATEQHYGAPAIYDMEGYAVARVCLAYGKKCQIVKAITDIIGNGKQAKQYDNNFEYTCEKLREWVRNQENNKKGETK